MHAHQSKAPRATLTLQHTHTYSTHSTAGTDQFIYHYNLNLKPQSSDTPNP